MSIYARVVSVLGRIFLSLIFIATGVSEIFSWEQAEKDLAFALTNWELYTTHAEQVSNFFTSTLAVVPILLITGIVLQLLGGFFLLLSYRIRFAAFLLFLYMLAATLIYQPFWFQEGPALSRSMVFFLNNVAIIGGLFIVLGAGGGVVSLGPVNTKKKDKKDEKSNDDDE